MDFFYAQDFDKVVVIQRLFWQMVLHKDKWYYKVHCKKITIASLRNFSGKYARLTFRSTSLRPLCQKSITDVVPEVPDVPVCQKTKKSDGTPKNSLTNFYEINKKIFVYVKSLIYLYCIIKNN